MHLSWADLTGTWPQAQWRTEQDLWYAGIRGEVLVLKLETDKKEREAKSEQTTPARARFSGG